MDLLEFARDTGSTPAMPATDGASADLPRGVPVRRVDGHLVTTVFDLLLAQYGVGRAGLPGEWAGGYDDATSPYTPAWQEAITGVPAATAARIGREFAATAEESRGRSMIVMGARQWRQGSSGRPTSRQGSAARGPHGGGGGGRVRPALPRDW